MFSVNPSVGWVANGFGKVYRTTDSGETWDEIASEGVFLRSIGFANEQKGWVGTFNASSVLLETNDGGVTWIDVSDRISGPAITGVCGLSVVNEDLVFGVGKFDGPAIFLKTVDGGASWQSTDLSVYGINTLIDVHFFDENRGVITGGTKADFTGQAIVAETIDGGDTGQVRHTSNLAANVGGEWGWKISFPTETTGYISVEYPFSNTTGNEAKVLKTTDGGISWSEIFVAGSTEPAGLQ
ncbi:MAG: YCF48-related protein [Rhodothermales bacterium]